MVDKDSIQEKSKLDVHESLSALADGELSSTELDRLLAKLKALPEQERESAMQKWTHFQQPTAVRSNPDFDISAKIMAAIDNEPPIGSQEQVTEAKPEHDRVHLKVVSTAATVATAKAEHSVSATAEIVDQDVINGKGINEDVANTRTAANAPIWVQWAVAASVCFAVLMSWQLWEWNPAAPNVIADSGVAVPVAPAASPVLISDNSASNLRTSPGATTVSTNQHQNRIVSPEQIPVIDAASLPLVPMTNLHGHLTDLSLRHNVNTRFGQTVNGSTPLMKVINLTEIDQGNGKSTIISSKEGVIPSEASQISE